MNFGQLTDAAALFRAESDYGKKNNESNIQWMKRVDDTLTQYLIGVPLIDQLKDVRIFDSIAVVLIKSLIDIAEEISDYTNLDSFKWIKETYGIERVHAKIAIISVIESATNPDRQLKARILMHRFFTQSWFNARYYSINHYFPGEETFDDYIKWYDGIVHPQKTPLRLYVDTDKAELNKYSYLENAKWDQTSCHMPFPGKSGACTREKGHVGPHMIKIPIVGIIAIWE